MSILFSVDASTDILPVIFISVVSVLSKAEKQSASLVILVLSANAICVKSGTSIAKDYVCTDFTPSNIGCLVLSAKIIQFYYNINFLYSQRFYSILHYNFCRLK